MELACFLRMVCQLIHFWFNVAHIAGLVAFLYLLPPRLGLDEPVPREIRRISAQTPGGWLGQHWMWVALVLRRSDEYM